MRFIDRRGELLILSVQLLSDGVVVSGPANGSTADPEEVQAATASRACTALRNERLAGSTVQIDAVRAIAWLERTLG